MGFNGQNGLRRAIFWARHPVRSASDISRTHHCQKTISLGHIPRLCGGHIGQWQHENAIVVAIHSPQSIFAIDGHGIHATSMESTAENFDSRLSIILPIMSPTHCIHIQKYLSGFLNMVNWKNHHVLSYPSINEYVFS